MATVLAFDPYATDWLNLLARWLHVVAGIVWIGSSFYFIALDNHLRPPRDEQDLDEGIGLGARRAVCHPFSCSVQ